MLVDKPAAVRPVKDQTAPSWSIGKMLYKKRIHRSGLLKAEPVVAILIFCMVSAIVCIPPSPAVASWLAEIHASSPAPVNSLEDSVSDTLQALSSALIKGLEELPAITPENAPRLRLLSKLEMGYPRIFSADSRWLALRAHGGIIIYDMHKLSQVAFLQFPDTSPKYQPFSFSPDGVLLAWMPQEGMVRIWDTRSQTVKCELRAPGACKIGNCVFSADGGLLAWGPCGDTVRIWYMHGQTEKHELQDLGCSGVRPLAFSPDGHLLVVRRRGRVVRICDIRDSTVVFERDHVNMLHVSPDKRTLALGTDEYPPKVVLIDVASQKELKTLSGFSTAAPVWGFDFSPDWRTMAWLSRGTIRLMDVATGNFGPDLSPYSNAVFAPDGRVLAGAEAGWYYSEPYLGRVVLFDVATGDTLAILEHDDHVLAITFSPDGRVVVTSTSQDSVALWDWVKAKKLITLSCSNKDDRKTLFSPNGRFLVIPSQGSNLLWGVLP
jgi:WD40 repeat protein